GNHRRQDDVSELRVPPGICPRPPPASLHLGRARGSSHWRRRHGDGRHGRDGWSYEVRDSQRINPPKSSAKGSDNAKHVVRTRLSKADSLALASRRFGRKRTSLKNL